MNPFPLRRLVCALLVAGLPLACTGDDGPTEPTPDPSISLSVSPTSVSLEEGDEATVTVTVTRSGGFSGGVSVSVSGLPQGVTAPGLSLAAGASSGTLALSAAVGAQVGSATLTLTASGSGVDPATATLSLQVTAAPTGGFQLALAASSLEVEQGSTGQVVVTVSRTAPFDGPVALAVTGAPSGVSAAVEPASVEGTSATLSIQVAADAAPGASTLTLTGTADGVDDQSVTLTLTVPDPDAQPSGGFSLALSPSSLSVQQGRSASVTLNVTREAPFDGAVAVSVSGAPAGVTVTADPASVTGDASTLTVTAAGNAATGAATLTVTGTADGVPEQSVTLSLSVTTAPSGTGYSWTFCPNTPVWFAVRDGDGAWTPVTPTGNRFDFSAASETVGVAYVIDDGSGTELQLRFLGAGEVDAVGAGLCPGSRSVTGSASGVASGTTFISLGGADAVLVAQGGTDFSLNNVRDGTVDLLGASTALTVQGTSVSSSLERVYLQRGLDPADGGTVAVDFAGPNSFDPGSATVTATGLNGDAAVTTVLYLTPGNDGILFQGLSFDGSASRTFPTVPADRHQSGDFHLLQLTTRPDGPNGTLGDSRAASVYFGAPGDQAVAFGPDLGATTLTTASTAPYAMPRVQYAQQAEYGRYFYASYSQSSGDRTVQVYMTDGWHGGTDVDFTVPDFSGLAGWSNSWGLQAGVEATYSFVTSGWQGGGALNPGPSGGVEIKTATRTGTFTP